MFWPNKNAHKNLQILFICLLLLIVQILGYLILTYVDPYLDPDLLKYRQQKANVLKILGEHRLKGTNGVYWVAHPT